MIITRLLQTIIVLSLLAIVLILLNSAASSAHEAVFVDSLAHSSNQVITFEQPDVDRIFYSNLATGGTVEFYSFQATAGLPFQAQILIPRASTPSKFRPALALFGPGLPKPDKTELYSVPFGLPNEDGLVTSIADKAQDNKTDADLYTPYDEPYTQSAFWQGQNLNRELPQSGIYYLAVFSPNNMTGKYALEIGNRDATGLKETLTFPLLWVSLKFWFGDYISPAVLLLLVLLIIVAIIIGRMALSRRS